jgi:hypothetical protein
LIYLLAPSVYGLCGVKVTPKAEMLTKVVLSAAPSLLDRAATKRGPKTDGFDPPPNAPAIYAQETVNCGFVKCAEDAVDAHLHHAAHESGVRKEAARRDPEMPAENIAEGLFLHRHAQPMADAPQQKRQPLAHVTEPSTAIGGGVVTRWTNHLRAMFVQPHDVATPISDRDG